MDRESFDYARYAKEEGFDFPDGAENNQDVRDLLYKDFVTNVYKEQRGGREQAILNTLELIPDARKELGIPEERGVKEQWDLVTTRNYKDWLKQQGLDADEFKDVSSEELVDGYISTLVKDKWANPNLAAVGKSQVADILKGKLVDTPYLSDLFSPPKDPETGETTTVGQQEQLEDEVDNLYDWAASVGKRFAPSLKRSVRDQDVQTAAQELRSPTLNKRDAYQTKTQYYEAIPFSEEELKANRDKAIKDLSDSINFREEIEVDKSIQAFMKEGMTLSEAIGALVDNPEVLAMVAAESGVDLVEEAGIQIGATVAGSIASPVAGVVAGAGAMSAQVRQNTANNYFAQEIEKWAKKNGKPLTPEVVREFVDNPQLYSEAKDKAETTANIIAGGAFASGVVGAGIAASQIAKVAARAGLEPVAQGGSIVFRRLKDTAAVTVPSIAASTTIDTTSDIASKVVVGDEVETGETVLTIAGGIAGGIPDVISGGIAGVSGRSVDQTPVDQTPVIRDRYQYDQKIENDLSEEGGLASNILGNKLEIAESVDPDLLRFEEPTMETLLGSDYKTVLDEAGEIYLEQDQAAAMDHLVEAMIANSDITFTDNGYQGSDNYNNRVINHLGKYTQQLRSSKVVDKPDVELDSWDVYPTPEQFSVIEQQQTTTLSELEGQTVQSGSKTGILTRKEGDWYLTPQDQSDPFPIAKINDERTAYELGVVVTDREDIGFDIPKRVVYSDWQNNRLNIRGQEYEFSGFEFDDKGVPGQLYVIDQNNKTISIRDKTVINQVESQKIAYELTDTYTDTEIRSVINEIDSDVLSRIDQPGGESRRGDKQNQTGQTEVTRKDGQPFKTRRAATAALTRRGVKGGNIVEKDNGFVGLYDMKEPVGPNPKRTDEEPIAKTNIRYELIPATKETVEVNWGGKELNYMPDEVLVDLINEGYKVDVKRTSGGEIASLYITDGLVRYEVKTRGVSTMTERDSDRNVRVYKNGKLIPRLGGNKNFTIPPATPTIKPGSSVVEFKQQVRDLGESLDMEMVGIGEISLGMKTEEGEQINFTLYEDDGTVIVNRNGEDQVFDKPFTMNKVDEIQTLKDADNKVHRQTLELLSVIDRKEPKSEPKTINNKIQDQLVQVEKHYEVQIPEDGVIKSGNFDIEIDGDNKDFTVAQVLTDTFSHGVEAMALSEDGSQLVRYDWDKSDVEKYVDLLPEHIQNMIELHDQPGNPAEAIGAWGFFTTNHLGRGPKIIIDVQNNKRDLQSVISTLSEEVAHFSLQSWSTGADDGVSRLSGVYTKAYQLFKVEIENNLDPYIQHYNVDTDNPTAFQQWVLVNELFSKKGTSFTNFVDHKISPLGDITDVEMEALKTEAREAIDTFVMDLNDVEGLTVDDKKEFARQILQMQSGGVTGKAVSFEYLSGQGQNRQKLTIRNTPFGQYRKDSPINAQTEWSEKRRKRINRWADDGEYQGLMRSLLTWTSQNNVFGESIVGRAIVRKITNDSAIGTHRDNQILRKENSLSRKVQAIARRNGIRNIDGSTFSNGAYETFKGLGITSRRQLSLARKYDDLQKTLVSRKIAKNEDLMQLFRKQSDFVKEWATRTNLPEERLGLILGELKDYAKKYRLDWDHVRYKAFEDANDQRVMLDMVDYLRQDPEAKDLKDKYNVAKLKLDRIENSDLSNSEKARKSEPYHQDIEAWERMEHLRKMFRAKKPDGYNEIQDLANDMILKIESVMRDSNYGRKSGLKRMDQVDANKTRRLDQNAKEGTSDYHEIRFLGKIEDPVEVGIYNLQQLSEIKRTMSANFDIAKELLLTGQASMERSSDHPELAFGDGQDGTLLKYIAIDPLSADDIRTQMEIQSEVVTNIWNSVIPFWKMNKTVFSAFGMASNFITMMHVSLFYGDYIRPLTNIVTGAKSQAQVGDATRGVGLAWHTKMINFDKRSKRQYVNQIIDEMQSHEVLGTGLSTLQVEVANKNDLAQKLVSSSTKFAEKLGVLKEENKITIDDTVTMTLDWLKEVYSFADDVPKVLRYMYNRDLAETKWRAKLNKDDFSTVGLYEQAILEHAVKEAADKTRRENTDFAAIPLDMKKIMYSHGRIVFGNFIGHSSQIVKIQAENVRIWKELLADMKEAKDGGHVQWQNQLRSEMSARTIGNMMTYGGLGAIGIGATSLTIQAFNGLQRMFADDDDDIMSSDELIGGQMVAQHLPFYGSGLMFNPTAIREGHKIYMIDGPRAEHWAALAPVPEPSLDRNHWKELYKIPVNLFYSGEAGNMSVQVIDALRGLDYNRQQIKSTQAYIDNLLTVGANLSTPQVAIELSQHWQGKSWYSDKPLPKSETTSRFFGVRSKEVDVRDVAYRVGRDLRKDLTRDELSGALSYEASTGHGVDRKSMISKIESDLENNAKLQSEYRHFVVGMEKLKYKQSEIVGYMNQHYSTNSKNNVKKQTLQKLVTGRDIFNQNSVDRVKKRLNDVRGIKIHKGDSFTQEHKNQAIKDLEWILEQYRLKTGLK